MKKTKIIATLGPATDSPEMIEELIKSGVNVFRINFSHGDHDEHLTRINRVKEVREKMNVKVALLADLQGPKIRVGEVDMFLHKGETVIFACDEPNEHEIPVQYQGLYQDVKEGDKLLLDDGLLEVKVSAVRGKKIEAKVVNGGQLTSKKGINLPTGSINADVVTAKDKKDAEFALENGADFLALSFVKTAEDIENLRGIIKNSKNKEAAIVAKIERHEAVYNFEKILVSADAVMVARGDLGIEVSQQKVPLIQKKITKKCLEVGKPCIVATQMLDSMIRNPRSTRAETSDIANAIIDGADAIMLSGETSVGKYPKEAVRAMNRIALDTEAWLAENKIDITENVQHNLNKVAEAVAKAAFELSVETKSKFIIAATTSGSNARQIAKFRPYRDIVAGTDSEETARRLALTWGVWPIVTKFENNRELTDKIIERLTREKLAKEGDFVTLVSGLTKGKIGGTNMIRIQEV